MQKLLVIDDEECIRQVVADLLFGKDWQVLEASDGATGVTMASALQPDIILLDYLLPEMTGEQVLRALKLRSETARIPVVLMSGMENDPCLEAMRGGAAGWLTKPFSRTQLVGTLDVATLMRPGAGQSFVERYLR